MLAIINTAIISEGLKGCLEIHMLVVQYNVCIVLAVKIGILF